MLVWNGGDKSLVGAGLRKNERRKTRDHAALKKMGSQERFREGCLFLFLR